MSIKKTGKGARLMRIKFTVQALLISLLAVFLMSGCTKTPEKMIIGKWINTDNGTIFQFFKEGTVVLTVGEEEHGTLYDDSISREAHTITAMSYEASVTGDYKFLDKDHIRTDFKEILPFSGVLKVVFKDDKLIISSEGERNKTVYYRYDSKQSKAYRNTRISLEDFAMMENMRTIDLALLDYATSNGVFPKTISDPNFLSHLPNSMMPTNNPCHEGEEIPLDQTGIVNNVMSAAESVKPTKRCGINYFVTPDQLSFSISGSDDANPPHLILYDKKIYYVTENDK